MSELTVPNHDHMSLDELRLYAPAQVNRSEWTGRRKVIGGLGREVWRGNATIADITTEVDERPWRAFIFALRGPVNWFRWPLPCNTHIGPMPVVGIGAGDGYSLPMSGLQPNATILDAGQFMTVPLPSGHARAVCLSAPLVSDVAGNAVASFEPALGEIPTTGTTIETVAPYIPMSATGNEAGFSLSDGVSGTSIEVEEAR